MNYSIIVETSYAVCNLFTKFILIVEFVFLLSCYLKNLLA
jgi:hypothetical protein